MPSLPVAPPFHLEATVRLLQRRPANAVNVLLEGRFARAFALGRERVLAQVANAGTIDAPDLRLAIAGRATAAQRDELRRTLRRMLGLDVDPARLGRLAAVDPRLAPIARALRGARPPRFASLFETFANVVPFQQVSLDAGVAISGRLVRRFGRPLEAGGRTWFAFPEAGDIAEARPSALREVGLSAQKAKTLRNVAAAIASGELAEARLERLSTEEALEELVELPGIGPWSAALVLLRGLGRLDVFPAGDVGVARGLTALLHLGPGEPAASFAERFGDSRGYLYFCSLGAQLLSRGLIHPAPGPEAPQASTPLE